MNMPSPMTVKNYDQSVKTMTKAVVEVAEQTMAEAAHDLKSSKGQHSGDDVVDIAVTCDGFASLNGSFTSISLDTGKILDIAVMSRYIHWYEELYNDIREDANGSWKVYNKTMFKSKSETFVS